MPPAMDREADGHGPRNKGKQPMLSPLLVASQSATPFASLEDLEPHRIPFGRKPVGAVADALQRLARPASASHHFHAHGSPASTSRGTASADATPPLSSPALFAPTAFSNPSTSSLSSYGGARSLSQRNSVSSLSVSEFGGSVYDDPRASWGRSGKRRSKRSSPDGDEGSQRSLNERKAYGRMRSHTEGSASWDAHRAGSLYASTSSSSLSWSYRHHSQHQRHLSEGRARGITSSSVGRAASTESPRLPKERVAPPALSSTANPSASIPSSPGRRRNPARRSASSLSRVLDADEGQQPSSSVLGSGIGAASAQSLRQSPRVSTFHHGDWYATEPRAPDGFASMMRRRSGDVAMVAARGASAAKRKGMGLLRRAGSFDVATVGASTWSTISRTPKSRSRSSSISSDALVYDLRDGKRRSSAATAHSVDRLDGFSAVRPTQSSSSASSGDRRGHARSLSDSKGWSSLEPPPPLRSPHSAMVEWERAIDPISSASSPRIGFMRFSQITEADDEDPDRTDGSLEKRAAAVVPPSQDHPPSAAAPARGSEAPAPSDEKRPAPSEVTIHLGVACPGTTSASAPRPPATGRRMSLAKKSYAALIDLLNPALSKDGLNAQQEPVQSLPEAAYVSAANGRGGGSGNHNGGGSNEAGAGRAAGSGNRGGTGGAGGGRGHAPGGPSGGGGGGGANGNGHGAGGGGGGGGGNWPNRGKAASGRSSPPVEQAYRRLELVGRGAYGAVYRGLHVASGAAVALKVVNLDTPEDDVSDIQREVALLSQLREADQKNVVRYWGCWLKGPELWIVMDFAEGGSVRTLMKAGPVAERFCALIVRETLVALAYLHKSGIIHRDVKAANILLTNTGRILLCDFGVAASLASNSAQSKRSTFVGTPYWMAPEVITEGKTYDQKADVWSLGITIYEMATGNPPLADIEQMRVIMLIPKSKPPRLPVEGEFSPAMRDFVACCLNEEPRERLTSEELTKHKWMKSCAKQPVALLKELIAQYNAWTKAGGMRMSLIGAETADWGDAGNRDSFAFDGHENGEAWEFNTWRSARDLQEAEDEEDMAAAPQPIRDHPLLRLFEAEPDFNSAPGGAMQPTLRNMQTLNARPAPPPPQQQQQQQQLEPSSQLATLKQAKSATSAPAQETPKQEGLSTAATAAKAAAAQDKASFVGTGATPFRFGAGGGSGVVGPPASSAAQPSVELASTTKDPQDRSHTPLPAEGQASPAGRSTPEVATPTATPQPGEKPSSLSIPSQVSTPTGATDPQQGAAAQIRPGVVIPSPSTAISPGPRSGIALGQQRYPGAHGNAARALMAHQRQSHGGSDPTLPSSSHTIHGRNLQSLWEGGPDTSAYGRLRKMRGGDWDGGLATSGMGGMSSSGGDAMSAASAMHTRGNGSGDQNPAVVDRSAAVAAAWNPYSRELPPGPPIRPLDFAALGTKDDVHAELARTVDELGRWLDVLSIGLARAVKVDALP
ncbi:related to ser/thr protein kinase [Pseudozyma flocculosa]|nr:related to ser/thr protein kinase [Pseudozyma flocculosa]